MKDWPSVALGDIFEIARGGSPRPIQNFLTEEPDGVNWVMIGDASDSSKYITHTKKRILKTGVKNSRMVYPGDFLLTNSMSFGHPYIMKTSGCIHDGWLVLSNKKGVIDQDYFYHLLGSDLIYAEFSRLASGSTVKNLNIEIVKGIKVSLPPLEEQRRIAAILDKADGVRRKRQEAIRLTEELLRSTFLEMFGDPVTNPKGWEKIKLGNLCTIVRGGSPRPINDYLGGSIPWIKIGDATEGDDIYIHKTAEAIKPDGVKKSRYLEPGSLIFANCGVSLGFARILKIAGCIHDGWLAFSDLDKSINQIFLLKLLNSITEHFRAIAPAGTQPNLNTTIMKNFEIPVPPIDLQEKFAVVSHYLTDSIQKNSEMFKESENLFNSLLQRAFRGEL